MRWYESLNDAADYGPGRRTEFEVGPTTIWYSRGVLIGFPGVTSGGTVKTVCEAAKHLWTPSNDPAATHVVLGSIQEEDRDIIFSLLQREVWSPNGQAAMLIRQKGLDHTSMQCGDIIQIGYILHVCHPNGWAEVDISGPVARNVKSGKYADD